MREARMRGLKSRFPVEEGLSLRHNGPQGSRWGNRVEIGSRGSVAQLCRDDRRRDAGA